MATCPGPMSLSWGCIRAVQSHEWVWGFIIIIIIIIIYIELIVCWGFPMSDITYKILSSMSHSALLCDSILFIGSAVRLEASVPLKG